VVSHTAAAALNLGAHALPAETAGQLPTSLLNLLDTLDGLHSETMGFLVAAKIEKQEYILNLYKLYIPYKHINVQYTDLTTLHIHE
jgi:hypothetical protein